MCILRIFIGQSFDDLKSWSRSFTPAGQASATRSRSRWASTRWRAAWRSSSTPTRASSTTRRPPPSTTTTTASTSRCRRRRRSLWRWSRRNVRCRTLRPDAESTSRFPLTPSWILFCWKKLQLLESALKYFLALHNKATRSLFNASFVIIAAAALQATIC